MLMVSLLAMSFTVAGADITQPPCHSQIRADDLCHATSLPGSAAETVKKPGVCLVCLVASDRTAIPMHRETRIHATFGTAALPDGRWTVPWRPPRA